ncbi:hypothetical protein GW879_01145, partial [Candidatus Kaiserbacteria bacterium]|nr:hypothetical protein [Candidatus Kaiserbacteria bacterium]
FKTSCGNLILKVVRPLSAINFLWTKSIHFSCNKKKRINGKKSGRIAIAIEIIGSKSIPILTRV